MGLQNKTRPESSYFIFIIILKKLISFFFLNKFTYIKYNLCVFGYV